MENITLNNQNDPELIKLLKASSVAYKKAKYWEIRITYFLVALAVAYPLYYVYFSNNAIKLTLFICSFLIAVLIQIFQNTFKGNTTKGALLKEEFDVLLFKLPRKTTLNKPDQAEISTLSSSYKGDKIKDWYSDSVTANINDNTSIAIFQRTNTGWDIGLRKKYCDWLVGSLIVYSIWLLVFLIRYKIDAETIFMIFFAILSFYSHFLSLLNGHRSVIKKRKHISEMLDNFIMNKQVISMTELRDIQDEIYLTRQESAKVPNFFFRCYKKKMNNAFENYIFTVNALYK